MADNVEKRIARALPVLRTERFWIEMPIASATSPRRRLRLASMTSRLTIIATLPRQMVRSSSDLRAIACARTYLRAIRNTPTAIGPTSIM